MLFLQQTTKMQLVNLRFKRCQLNLIMLMVIYVCWHHTSSAFVVVEHGNTSHAVSLA